METLSIFCDLRSQSVRQQLAGEAGTVDASGITLSDMGTMNHGMGGGNMQMPGQTDPAGTPSGTDETTRDSQQFPGFAPQENMEFPAEMEPPEGAENLSPGQDSSTQADPSNTAQTGSAPTQGNYPWVLIIVTAGILAAGLLFVLKFKR